MKQEIEILWRLLEDKEAAIEKLTSCLFVKEKKVIDYYLFDPLRPELKPTNEGRLSACLRVRSSDSGASMTYKKDHFEGEKWLYSDEIETSVEDPEKTKNILRALGMELLVTVAVQKRVYTFAEYEIVLEDVDGLGLFLEIEYRGTDQQKKIETIKEEMRSVIQKLKLQVGEEENAGKPELLLRANRVSE